MHLMPDFIQLFSAWWEANWLNENHDDIWLILKVRWMKNEIKFSKNDKQHLYLKWIKK